ncbi:shikimate dehydrogenase [Streptococcus gordonii]|uniref:shikimate dehydrogenase n=1 Tax=Streptococcus gordonii TaxID=1302 RepID=UPI001CBDC2C6|nr:shikimate dehydrogenase [Streptococcus gordonii]MBZ2147412.1 shikimate dehydrogenase [Streptococcus gordonii]
MKIDGHTRLAAVIAKPIKHSISPFIHNMAYDLTDTNAVYLAFEVEREGLGQAVENIRLHQMLGANISMPYKQEVITYLDELDESALLIGAVNTIVNQNGRLIGYNTDGFGFFRSLSNFHIKGKNLTILGAGGAASAIIGQAVLDGVEKVCVFDLIDRLAGHQEKIEQMSRRLGHPIQLLAVEDLAALTDAVNQSDLFINATGMGMDGKSLPIPSDFVFPKGLLVADMTYCPAETPFLRLAREQGLQTVNGLGMLLYQAEKAFELMTGKKMPSEEIKKALIEKLEI